MTDSNPAFFHLSWMSLTLSIFSFLVLTPVTAPVVLALGVVAGVKGHAMGWVGAVLSFIAGCLWIAMMILISD